MNRIITKLDFMKEYANVPWHYIWKSGNPSDAIYWCGKKLIHVNGKWVAFEMCPYCGENNLNDENVCNCCGVPLWWWV